MAAEQPPRAPPREKKRRPPTATELAALQRAPRRTRAVCVLGHVDHGKSSLVDWLLAENGVLPPRLAGKARFLDDTEDEQARGITMRASAVTIRCARPVGAARGGNRTSRRLQDAVARACGSRHLVAGTRRGCSD